MVKKILLSAVAAVIFISSSLPVRADIPLGSPVVILMEQTTHEILYTRGDIHRRMFPASLTKMLTAMVVVDHLSMNTVVIVDQDLLSMPPGFTSAIHFRGETVTIYTLMLAMMIRSANESSRVLALAVMRHLHDDPEMDYFTAKPLFSELMNEKAREIGAMDTNNTNPYGLHEESHFSTAFDLALISAAYMSNPVLAEIARTQRFVGDSLNGVQFFGQDITVYEFVNTNVLLPGGSWPHEHVTGIKTGFTDAAGRVFAGSATHNDLNLISVVLGGVDDLTRWEDTRALIDFGFANFAFRTIAVADIPLKSVSIENPRLGDDDIMEVISTMGHTLLLGIDASVTHEIVFDEEFVVMTAESESGNVDETTYERQTVLRAPIEEGEIVGTIRYFANGAVIFEAPVIAGREVIERTFSSDIQFYRSAFSATVFSLRALPFWITGIIFILGFVRFFGYLREKRRIKAYYLRKYGKQRVRRTSRYDGR